MVMHTQKQKKCHIQGKVHSQITKICGPDFSHTKTPEITPQKFLAVKLKQVRKAR